MIVVDASALAAFLLKEPGWRRLADYISNSVSVDLVAKETANAVWKAYAARGIVDEIQARKLYELLESMLGVNVLLEPEDKHLGEAFQIALENKITVYDALYLALAKKKKATLLTLDVSQARTAGKLGVKTITLHEPKRRKRH